MIGKDSFCANARLLWRIDDQRNGQLKESKVLAI
jgi:hypothetical protein